MTKISVLVKFLEEIFDKAIQRAMSVQRGQMLHLEQKK